MVWEVLSQNVPGGMSTWIPPILTGFFGLLGTIVGVLFQRRSEHNRQVNDNIYRPLFNELKRVSCEGLPYNPEKRRFDSYWFELDWYWKSKVDEDLQSDIIQYIDNLETMNLVLETIAEEIISNRSQLGDLWDGTSGHGDSEYIENKLLMKQNQAGSRRTFKPLITWLSEYHSALFQATDLDELRSHLESQAEKKSPEHRRAIDQWSDRDLVVLGEAIEEADENISFPNELSSVHELNEHLETQADQLADRVNNKSSYLI